VVSSLQQLVADLGGTLNERSATVLDVYSPEPLTLEGLTGDRLELDDIDVRGTLVFKNCFFSDLRVSNCATDCVVIIGCHIRRITVRKFSPQCVLNISDTRCEMVSAHDLPEISADAVVADSAFTVTAVRRRVSISHLDAGSLTIGEQLVADAIEVTVTGARIAENLHIHDFHAGSLTVSDTAVGRSLRLRRLAFDRELKLADLECHGRTIIENVSGRNPIQLVRCNLRDDLEGTGLRQLADDMAMLQLVRSRIGGAVSVTMVSDAGKVELWETAVNGRIAFPVLSPRYQMGSGTVVSAIELDAERARSARHIRMLALRCFGETTATAYRVLRVSFAARHRISEEDLCYYLQRDAEARNLARPGRWLHRWLFGGVLGWGVLILPPTRALAVGIILTGLVLTGTGASPAVEAGDLGGAMTLAAALWFNVGTGLPQHLTTTPWSALAVACTAAGLILITVIVGVTIRKLVR